MSPSGGGLFLCRGSDFLYGRRLLFARFINRNNEKSDKTDVLIAI